MKETVNVIVAEFVESNAGQGIIPEKITVIDIDPSYKGTLDVVSEVADQ